MTTPPNSSAAGIEGTQEQAGKRSAAPSEDAQSSSRPALSAVGPESAPQVETLPIDSDGQVATPHDASLPPATADTPRPDVMKSDYATLLNELDQMQQSFIYAARKSTLANAELVIVQLERELTAARAELEAERTALDEARLKAITLRRELEAAEREAERIASTHKALMQRVERERDELRQHAEAMADAIPRNWEEREAYKQWKAKQEKPFDAAIDAAKDGGA